MCLLRKRFEFGNGFPRSFRFAPFPRNDRCTIELPLSLRGRQGRPWQSASPTAPIRPYVITRLANRGPRKGEWPLWGEEKPRHRRNFSLAKNVTLCLVLRRCGNLFSKFKSLAEPIPQLSTFNYQLSIFCKCGTMGVSWSKGEAYEYCGNSLRGAGAETKLH